MRLRDKVAVVTGAGRGLGRAFSEAFSREGAKLVISDITQDVFTVADQIKKAGGDVIALNCDVTKSKDVKTMFKSVQENFGGLDILLNNAGIMPAGDHSVIDTDEDVWNQVINVNLNGIYLCCKYGIPMLIERGGGSVVNLGSMVSMVGCTVPQDAYTASKGAINSLTRSMAVQFGRQKVRVNALCPGPIGSPGVMDDILNSEVERNRRLVHIPMGRFALWEDIVGAAIYLASDESSWTTGSCLVIDGGLTVNYF